MNQEDDCNNDWQENNNLTRKRLQGWSGWFMMSSSGCVTFSHANTIDGISLREGWETTCNLTAGWLKGLTMGRFRDRFSDWGWTTFIGKSWIQYGRGLSYCLLPHCDLPRRQTRPADSRRTDYISQRPPGLPTGQVLPDWSHYLNCWACLLAVEEAEVEGVRWWMIEPGFRAPGSVL